MNWPATSQTVDITREINHYSCNDVDNDDDDNKTKKKKCTLFAIFGFWYVFFFLAEIIVALHDATLIQHIWSSSNFGSLAHNSVIFILCLKKNTFFIKWKNSLFVHFFLSSSTIHNTFNFWILVQIVGFVMEHSVLLLLYVCVDLCNRQ